MTILPDSAAGLLLALSFALLWQRRLACVLVVVALQGLVVAVVAAGQGAWPLALVELGWGAVGLPWLLSRGAAATVPDALGAAVAGRMGLPTARFVGGGSAGGLLAGAVLAAVALPLGVIGPGLAVVLLGVLFVASRPSGGMAVAGAASVQSGAALAGVACGGGMALLIAPLLPAVVLGWAWRRDTLVAGAGRSSPSAPPSPASPVQAREPVPDSTQRPAAHAIPGESAEESRETGEAWPVPARASAALSWLPMVDFAGCALLVLLAGVLPWVGVVAGPWRLDPLGILAAILASLVVAALRWPGYAADVPRRWSGHVVDVLLRSSRRDAGTVLRSPSHDAGVPLRSPLGDGGAPPRWVRRDRHTPLRWVGRGGDIPFGGCLTTLGALLAVLARPPALAWIGLAIATIGALAAAPPRYRRLAAIGLGLTLVGSLTLAAAPLPATATLLVGLGCLGVLAPELAALAALMVLRLRSELPVAAGLRSLPPTPGLDTLLLAAGLLALLLAVGGLATERPNRRMPAFATLGQAGIAIVALGIDTPGARFAAVLQVILLILTRLALDLARECGLSRALAVASLAGLPGLFPSLALLLTAAASAEPALLPPLAAGLAALAWLLLRQLPAGPYPVRPDLAWLPLAALLLLGFAMPGPLGAGLHLVAEQLR